MDLDLLYTILAETTIQLRNGPVVQTDRVAGVLGVTEVFAMPHESEARPDLERVDMELLTIGVDKSKAEERREDLVRVLADYPNPERLAGGPSYIEVGAEIGDQGAAFQLFALGKALGLWGVITPATLGLNGDDAHRMAGNGFVMMTGYDAAAAKKG